jgi:hypothetical protein
MPRQGFQGAVQERLKLCSSSAGCKAACEDEEGAADGTRPAVAVMAAVAVAFGPVDKDNVQRLRELNLQLFPVRYNLAFYKEVVSSPPGYAQLGRAEVSVVLPRGTSIDP